MHPLIFKIVLYNNRRSRSLALPTEEHFKIHSSQRILQPSAALQRRQTVDEHKSQATLTLWNILQTILLNIPASHSNPYPHLRSEWWEHMWEMLFIFCHLHSEPLAPNTQISFWESYMKKNPVKDHLKQPTSLTCSAEKTSQKNKKLKQEKQYPECKTLNKSTATRGLITRIW